MLVIICGGVSVSVLVWLIFAISVALLDILLRDGRYKRIATLSLTTRQVAEYEWLLLYVMLLALCGIVVEIISDYSGLALMYIAPVILPLYMIVWSRRTLLVKYGMRNQLVSQKVLYYGYILAVAVVVYAQYVGISTETASLLGQILTLIVCVPVDLMLSIECIRRFVHVITVEHPARPTIE